MSVDDIREQQQIDEDVREYMNDMEEEAREEADEETAGWRESMEDD